MVVAQATGAVAPNGRPSMTERLPLFVRGAPELAWRSFALALTFVAEAPITRWDAVFSQRFAL